MARYSNIFAGGMASCNINGRNISTLCISMKPGTYENLVVNGESPTVYITNKNLKDVSASGSGDFTVNGDLTAPDGFTVRSSGSSDFKCGVIRADKKMLRFPHQALVI